MNDTQLDRLSKLTELFVTIAKVGGTPALTRVQAHVSQNLDDLLDELDGKEDKPQLKPIPDRFDESGKSLVGYRSPVNQPMLERDSGSEASVERRV